MSYEQTMEKIENVIQKFENAQIDNRGMKIARNILEMHRPLLDGLCGNLCEWEEEDEYGYNRTRYMMYPCTTARIIEEGLK